MTTTEGQGPPLRPLWNRLRGLRPAPEVEIPMRVHTDGDGVIWVAGALDLATVSGVRALLRATDPTGRTVVDVSGLHFIDSSGLGCLLAHDDRVRRAGGEFVVRGPDARLQRVFEVTGAFDRLTILA